MGSNVQTPSHEGLRAWFELLRTERRGQMPKYWVDRKYDSIHCSHPECKRLTIGALAPEDWDLRQRDGSSYLFAFRHRESCPWQQRVDMGAQNSFTTQPLERAYLYWARFEHKFNHK